MGFPLGTLQPSAARAPGWDSAALEFGHRLDQVEELPESCVQKPLSCSSVFACSITLAALGLIHPMTSLTLGTEVAVLATGY